MHNQTGKLPARRAGECPPARLLLAGRGLQNCQIQGMDCSNIVGNPQNYAEDLLESPEMQPYVRLAMAGLKGANVDSELQAIREMPLERRYIWRVASALKWAFADFDTVNVRVDRDTLADQDLATVLKMLELRPIQFCLFLRALVGPLRMGQMMVEAIKTARDLGDV